MDGVTIHSQFISGTQVYRYTDKNRVITPKRCL